MRPSLLLLSLIGLLTSCGEQREDHDVARFAKWKQAGTNAAKAKALQTYLNREGVGNVIPLRQLLRSDTKWRLCGVEPFAVPPQEIWPHIVPTLKLIRNEVKPLVGPVEALSVFRTTQVNRCIRGASRSFHLRFHALDMKPATSVTRQQLINKLCRLHREKGKQLNMGLGIYKGTRFHIDTAGYRGWGHDYRGATFPCSKTTD
jgi:hypothetical protein